MEVFTCPGCNDGRALPCHPLAQAGRQPGGMLDTGDYPDDLTSKYNHFSEYLPFEGQCYAKPFFSSDKQSSLEYFPLPAYDKQIIYF